MPRARLCRSVCRCRWVSFRWRWSAEIGCESHFFLRCRRQKRYRGLLRGLVEELSKRAAGGSVLLGATDAFDPPRFDAFLYHIGNNPHHDFVYETALRHPGFVVMHEANLHHLIAHLTIRRDDWDAYVAECEYRTAAPRRSNLRNACARLEVGPDYEGVPMTRRLLQASKA